MRHVVDQLIDERSEGLRSRPWLWRLITSLFYPILGYERAKTLVDQVQNLSGEEVLDSVSSQLQLKVSTSGLEHLPTRGRAMLVANHPAGIADGIAVYDAIKHLREDVVIFANRDAVRMAPGLASHIIPVEWIEEKRTRAQQRDMIRQIVAAFRAEKLVVIFPSGRLAYLKWSGLTERPWQTTAVNLAQKYCCEIIPMHINARNSLLFYAVSLISDELRDITLFHELMNKRNKTYRLNIGAPIDPAGDVREVTDALEHYVTQQLSKGDAHCTALRKPPHRTAPQTPDPIDLKTT